MYTCMKCKETIVLNNLKEGYLYKRECERIMSDNNREIRITRSRRERKELTAATTNSIIVTPTIKREEFDTQTEMEFGTEVKTSIDTEPVKNIDYAIQLVVL